MKSNLLALLAVGAAAALFAGCAEAPTAYPVSYQIPIGYSQVPTAYGTQSINVSATHDSIVTPGVPMYYQVISPVPLTLYVFDKTGPGPGGALLNQTQGTIISATATATSSTLEFVFSTVQPYTGGTVQFTISDHPLPPVTTDVAPTPVQSTTTTTTTTAPNPNAPGTTTTQSTTTTTPAAPAPVMNQSQGPVISLSPASAPGRGPANLRKPSAPTRKGQRQIEYTAVARAERIGGARCEAPTALGDAAREASALGSMRSTL